MNKVYTVFSCNHAKTQVKVKLPEDVIAMAEIDSVQVQLTPVDGKGGTVQVTFTGPAAIGEAETLFVAGAEINVEFSGV